MTPIKYTVKYDITHFHYNYSELREFVRLGKANGNVGLLLVKREGCFFTYKGFGTIQNPMHSMISVKLRHVAMFDGPMPSDDERLVPPASPSTDYKMIFLNE
jgi:hypothetical protein